MPYNIDEKRGDIIFQVDGDKIILKIKDGILGGGSGGSGNVDIIKEFDLSDPTDFNVYSALRSRSEFISKNEPDEVKGLITFWAGINVHGKSTLEDVSVSNLEVLENLEIGKFIDSMLHGMGAGFDKHGNGQVESLKIRSFLMVTELIYNRLNALEGDYTFTDFGTIDAIDQVDATTYNLTIRKRWENDFTAFQEHDVLYGIYNGGTSFFTSWMRVLTKDTMANIITVVLYADSEVPAQRNFAPCKGMNISRRGNAIAMEEHNKRQDSWQLSSYEGAITFMQSVAKPILEQSNYAMSIGKLPKLDIFKDLPINYDQPYIYARGAIIQDLYRLDYEGNIRKEIIDRGLWSLETAKTKPYWCTEIEVHEVWHDSCKYQAIINETQQEPRYNATDWLQVAGDTRLILELYSSNGVDFLGSNVKTTITAFVYKGVTDITADIEVADWEWSRKTDDPVSDTTWGILHANAAHSIDISIDDLGLNIHTTRQCAFICKAYVRDKNNVRFEDISELFEA